MSLSSGPAGGKGVDSSAVDTYDSGDEWDIGVGNLIIDLDADLEKDKLEMSSNKEGGGMAAPPSAVATLPENIKFVSPVAAMQGKESKSKSKRSKNSKESIKAPVSDGTKKEIQGRVAIEPPPQNPSSVPAKGSDKCSKSSRTLPAVKKDKDMVSGKAKKDKLDLMSSGAASADESVAAIVPMGASCIGPFEGQQNAEHAAAKQLGSVTLDSSTIVPPVAMTSDQEVDDGDCRNLKKVVGVKVGIIIILLRAHLVSNESGWGDKTRRWILNVSVVQRLLLKSKFPVNGHLSCYTRPVHEVFTTAALKLLQNDLITSRLI